MIKVYDNESGQSLGTITDEELQFLIDELEEESLEDRDYYLSRDTLDMLNKEGAPPALMDLLRKALGDRDGIEIRWSRT